MALTVALGFVGLSACKASVGAEAKASTSGQAEAQANLDTETEDQDGESASEPADATKGTSSLSDTAAANPAMAMLGARPDLTLAPGNGDKACQCLSVAVGQPNDPFFVWQSGPPLTDSASQVVIALSSAASGCAAKAQGEPGASYWGYEKSGADVVVVVENARPGRPVIQGAIIPRPVGSGRIQVKPLDKNVSYGRSSDGSGGLCSLKFPGS